MAIKNVMIDDMDSTEGASTHSFSIDGDRYQIDLVDANYRSLKEALAPFVKYARKQGQPPKKVSKVKGAQSAADMNAIRDWAKSQGRKVAERGRIPQDIQDAFYAAHDSKKKGDASTPVDDPTLLSDAS